MTTSPRSDVTMQDHWDELVAVAMLGTDRRNPPSATVEIADLVADTVRETPAGRMLAQVAATVAVRRAGVLPGPAVAPLAGPPADERPVISDVAAQRWYEMMTRWPVLEDEWSNTVLATGRRLRPEMVPDVLEAHRRDPRRWARAIAAAGSIGPWIVDHAPWLAGRPPSADELAAIVDLPHLPIPADLTALMDETDDVIATELARRLVVGDLLVAHRGVLVNVVARVNPTALEGIERALGAVVTDLRAGALANQLADLAALRRALLADLA